MSGPSKPPLVNCPSCGRPVEWRPENRYRPFCSERCRQIDLGAWANDSYRVPSTDPGSADGSDSVGGGGSG